MRYINRLFTYLLTIYCGVLQVLTDGRNSRFPLQRYQLPQRGGMARPRPATSLETRACRRGNAVGLTSILH